MESQVYSPSYIQVYYDSYPFNLYTAGTVIPIGTTVANSSGMSVSSNAIFLPSGVSGKYEVSVSIPVYKESAIQLYDGDNNGISGTYSVGGHPTTDICMPNMSCKRDLFGFCRSSEHMSISMR